MSGTKKLSLRFSDEYRPSQLTEFARLMGREVKDVGDLAQQLRDRGFDVSEYIRRKRNGREDGGEDVALQYLYEYVGLGDRKRGEESERVCDAQEDVPVAHEASVGEEEWAFGNADFPVEDDYFPEVDFSGFDGDFDVPQPVGLSREETVGGVEMREPAVENGCDAESEVSLGREVPESEAVDRVLDEALLDFEPPPAWLDEAFGYDDPSFGRQAGKERRPELEEPLPADGLSKRVLSELERANELQEERTAESVDEVRMCKPQ